MKENEIKDMVLFWGWTQNDKTYKNFVHAAPPDWRIHQVSYAKLMPAGDTVRFLDNALKFFEEQNLTRASVAGHSMGGALGLIFAAHFPEKVEHLYLVDSAGIYGRQSIFHLLKNVVSSSPGSQGKETEGTLTRVKRIFRHPLIHTRLAYFSYKADLQEEAASLEVPTTVFCGEEDQLTPLERSQKLHQLIKNSELKIMPNQGHDWILHTPQLFWENI